MIDFIIDPYCLMHHLIYTTKYPTSLVLIVNDSCVSVIELLKKRLLSVKMVVLALVQPFCPLAGIADRRLPHVSRVTRLSS